MGCFLIGSTGQGTKEAILGSVSDNPYDIRTFLKFVKEDKFSHIGTELISTTEHTLKQRGYFAKAQETTRGVNEKGLAFTCAIVTEKEDLPRPKNATPFAKITQYIMQNCVTVQEAIDYFVSQKEIFPAYSVLLADAFTTLAHIEVGSYGTNVNHKHSLEKPGAVFAVNCYLSKAFCDYNASSTLISNLENNNAFRLNQGKALAQTFSKVDVKAMQKVLSDHKHKEIDPRKNPMLEAWGYSICNHGTRQKNTYVKEDLPWGTISAEIMQPSKRQFWYAYGWPCGEKPTYQDQLFQENSWGQFIPFGFKQKGEKTARLTTVFGEITKEGMKYKA